MVTVAYSRVEIDGVSGFQVKHFRADGEFQVARNQIEQFHPRVLVRADFSEAMGSNSAKNAFSFRSVALKSRLSNL